MNKYIYILLLIMNFALTTRISSQSVDLVLDIIPGVESGFSTQNEGIKLSFEDKVLFVINRQGSRELWVSNGYANGSNIIHALNEGRVFSNFISVNSQEIYYSTSEGHIYALSESNLDTNFIYSGNGAIRHLTFFNGHLFFGQGDALIKLNPQSRISELVYQFDFFYGLKDIGLVNDGLIVMGGGMIGLELFYSDGTKEGTRSYYLINNESDFSGDYFMTQIDNKLFFFHNKPGLPYLLYVTDGTQEGTKKLIELQRLDFINLERDRSIIAWNGKLFFRGREWENSTGGQDELFVSDGTVEGTKKLNINDEWSKPMYFTPYKDELYFQADFAGSIYTIYKTDGTQEGTSFVINGSELGGGLSFGGSHMIVHDNQLFFSAYRSEIGEELWYSEGTTNTTNSIDIVPGTASSSPVQMTSTNNFLFFIYNSMEYGEELFVLDREILSTLNPLQEKISLYPNPFIDVINIEFESVKNNITVEINNITGQLIYQESPKHNKIFLNSIPSGLYLINIRMDNLVVSEQLIIKY